LAVTHDVRFQDGKVVKRFCGHAHAEARREWQALRLLARYAPGLSPEPVQSCLNASPPVVVMTAVPGSSLGREAITDGQLDAIAGALSQLHCAVPAPVLSGLEIASEPAALASQVRQMAPTFPAAELGQLPGHALRAALSWLESGWASELRSTDARLVFGQGDGNLANHLWDGNRVRLVDFEDSGPSTRARELADFVEHISVWAHGQVDAASFLSRFDLSADERRQVLVMRRLFAAFWLMMLIPGGRASQRNPAGTLELQAARMLTLLG
jgi:thiamine kinase-like enzyme